LEEKLTANEFGLMKAIERQMTAMSLISNYCKSAGQKTILAKKPLMMW